MIVDCFLDTNILVYAAVGRFAAPEKYARSRQLIAETHFGLSGQVLQEFFVNATRKSDTPLSVEEALKWIDGMRDRPCVAIDIDVVARGARIAARFQTSYWDGAIIASAERLNAPLLYTEDLNHGQFYGAVQAINPFIPN